MATQPKPIFSGFFTRPPQCTFWRFRAARIWRHAGRVGVSYSDHYQEKDLFQRLMERLRSVARGAHGFAPVLPAPLRA
ncbi:MAG: hypothetical protein ACYCSP_10970 [Acidobacteriaceae bacterium]